MQRAPERCYPARMSARTAVSLLTCVLACHSAPATEEEGSGRQTQTVRGLDSGDTGTVPQGTLLEAVTWRIAWDLDGLLPTEAGSWQIDRSDGASFVLGSGWLVLESVALEPCAEVTPEARQAPPHGWPDHPSADTDSWALPLHEPMNQELSRRAFDLQQVCEVGVGLFQAHADTRARPEEPDLLGTSLWLEGWVRRSPTESWTPVEWRSSLSAEQDAVLPPLADTEAVLTVSLSPARLLDAVYLDDPPELAGRSALTNLARSLSVAAQP